MCTQIGRWLSHIASFITFERDGDGFVIARRLRHCSAALMRGVDHADLNRSDSPPPHRTSAQLPGSDLGRLRRIGYARPGVTRTVMVNPIAATAFSVVHRGVRCGDELLDQRLAPSVIYITECSARGADTRGDSNGEAAIASQIS